MFITIGTFLAGIIGKPGIAQKTAKIVGIVAAVLLLIVVLGVGKCTYDKSVIDEHETKEAVKTEKADRKADTKAAETRRVDDARLHTEETQLKEIRENEKDQTAHERRIARAACIRLQQSARAKGSVAPACR